MTATERTYKMSAQPTIFSLEEALLNIKDGSRGKYRKCLVRRTLRPTLNTCARRRRWPPVTLRPSYEGRKVLYLPQMWESWVDNFVGRETNEIKRFMVILNRNIFFIVYHT